MVEDLEVTQPGHASGHRARQAAAEVGRLHRAAVAGASRRPRRARTEVLSPQRAGSARERGDARPVSGRVAVGTLVEVAAHAPEADAAVVRAGEDQPAVGGDRVDGRVVGLGLADEGAGVDGPELEVAGPAARDDDLGAGEEAHAADPVLVGVVDRADVLVGAEVPLLDAGVPRG